MLYMNFLFRIVAKHKIGSLGIVTIVSHCSRLWGVLDGMTGTIEKQELAGKPERQESRNDRNRMTRIIVTPVYWYNVASCANKQKRKTNSRNNKISQIFLLAAPIHFLHQHYDKIKTQPFNLLSKYKLKDIFSNW
jgi:hypothetical protein